MKSLVNLKLIHCGIDKVSVKYPIHLNSVHETEDVLSDFKCLYGSCILQDFRSNKFNPFVLFVDYKQKSGQKKRKLFCLLVLFPNRSEVNDDLIN